MELRGAKDARMNARSPCEGLGGGVVVLVLGGCRVYQTSVTVTQTN